MPLVQHFVQQYAAKLGKSVPALPSGVMALLRAYAWPGNVRELQYIIERAVILTQGPVLEAVLWL